MGLLAESSHITVTGVKSIMVMSLKYFCRTQQDALFSQLYDNSKAHYAFDEYIPKYLISKS